MLCTELCFMKENVDADISKKNVYFPSLSLRDSTLLLTDIYPHECVEDGKKNISYFEQKLPYLISC